MFKPVQRCRSCVTALFALCCVSRTLASCVVPPAVIAAGHNLSRTLFSEVAGVTTAGTCAYECARAGPSRCVSFVYWAPVPLSSAAARTATHCFVENATLTLPRYSPESHSVPNRSTLFEDRDGPSQWELVVGAGGCPTHTLLVSRDQGLEVLSPRESIDLPLTMTVAVNGSGLFTMQLATAVSNIKLGVFVHAQVSALTRASFAMLAYALRPTFQYGARIVWLDAIDNPEAAVALGVAAVPGFVAVRGPHQSPAKYAVFQRSSENIWWDARAAVSGHDVDGRLWRNGTKGWVLVADQVAGNISQIVTDALLQALAQHDLIRVARLAESARLVTVSTQAEDNLLCLALPHCLWCIAEIFFLLMLASLLMACWRFETGGWFGALLLRALIIGAGAWLWLLNTNALLNLHRCAWNPATFDPSMACPGHLELKYAELPKLLTIPFVVSGVVSIFLFWIAALARNVGVR